MSQKEGITVCILAASLRLDASMSAMGIGEITRDELNEWMAKDPELSER